MKEAQFLEAVPSVDEITKHVMDWLLKKYGFKAKEIGPYRMSVRFDVLGINRHKREIRIVEVKSCRRDFVSDKKWQSYLPYCTHFAFAVPKGVISLEELPPGIGLIEYWYDESRYWDGSTYHTLQYEYIRGCRRLRERPEDGHYIDLLEGIVMRQMMQAVEFSQYWAMKKEIESLRQGMDKLLEVTEKSKRPKGRRD